MLAAELTKAGIPATHWRNAGGRRWLGRVAQRLGRRDADHLLGTTAALVIEGVLRWFAIARSLMVSRLLRRVAVMDRYAYCQYASIRAHSGGHERLARRLYRLFPMPNVTLHLALPPKQAYLRIEARGTDHEDLDYLATTDDAYRSLPEAILFTQVDASGPPDEVHDRILAALSTPRTEPALLPIHSLGI